MTRNDFLKICGVLGVGIPLHTTLNSCNTDDSTMTKFTGKVVIVGAGAGGLAAGYLLQQQGIAFEILEASDRYGGRMRINTEFADFPIPLGAEWLHSSTNVFQQIVNDTSVTVNVETENYDSQNDTYALWQNNQLSVSPLNDSDIKFVNYSWFNFFEDYIVPSVADKIIYNTVVQSINYSGDQVIVNTQNGQHEGDKLVVSVPLKILQDGDIDFTPALPQNKLNAINELTVWEGFKAFFQFSQKFYDTTIDFNISPATDGQKLYYDASYGQNTTKNILGLFVVGKPVLDYSSLSDNALKDFVLNELDQIYPNMATTHYEKHISQNWNNEPFIKAGYLSDEVNWRTVRTLSESVADKIYFAGGPYTDGEDWVSVHAAAQSAKVAITELVS